MDDLKSYVIRYVYGDLHSASLDMARAVKWKKQKKKSLVCLPPDDDSVEQHILHTNYLAYIQRHPNLKSHPSPIGNGWELVNGCCRPVCFTKPALPPVFTVPSLPQHGGNSDCESESDNSDGLGTDSYESSDEDV